MLERYILPKQYQTGHDVVDEQHAHLFSILRAIDTLVKNEKTMSTSKVQDEGNELLGLLQNYTRNHFQYEENLMEKVNYPEIMNHKEIHQAFRVKVGEFQDGFLKVGSNRTEILMKLEAYVRNWYLKHVLDEDKRMVAFYVENKKAGGKALP